jgi:hypothetical protein
MDLGRLVIVRFDRLTTIPLFMPLIYRWAGSLSAGHQSTNPTIYYFRWCQDLVSQIYGMCHSTQPLASVVSQSWLAPDYFMWFTPEWHRGLLAWLMTQELATFTVDENAAEWMPRELHPGMIDPERYTTYAEPEGRSTFLRGALERDISLPTGAPSRSKETVERSHMARGLPLALRPLLNLMTDLSLPAGRSHSATPTRPGLMSHKGFLASRMARNGTRYAELSRSPKWMEEMLRYPGNDVEGATRFHGERSEEHQISQSLLSFRPHVEAETAEWQRGRTILTPVALGPRRVAGDRMKEGTGIEGEQTEPESPYLQRLLTRWQDSVLHQRQDIYNVSSPSPERARAIVPKGAARSLVEILESPRSALAPKETAPDSNLPSFGAVAESLTEGVEIVEASSRLEALASMLPNLRQLLSQSEAQDVVVALPSHLGKSNPHPVDEAQAYGIPLMEVYATGEQTLSGGHILRQMPSDSAWDMHHTQAADLFLVPKRSAGSGDTSPIDFTEWGEQAGYSERATRVLGVPSVNPAKPTGPPDLALAPLARPRGDSGTPPPPGGEASALPGAERAEGAEKADPEALAGEVYKILKQRLLVEREQARGMV